MVCECFVGAARGVKQLASEAHIHSFRCPTPKEAGAHVSKRAHHDLEDDVPEWATDYDLNHWNTKGLIGKRVQIKEFTIDVLSSLGAGKTGETFMAEVVEPESQRGTLMALKFRQGNATDLRLNMNKKEVEQLALAANIYKKMASPKPVPNCVLMQAFGMLKVPRKLFGVTLWGCPITSRVGKGLLITLAAGAPLERTSFSSEEEKAACRQQLRDFAEGMYSKGLIHADLTIENVYWDPESWRATVIDFANAVDARAKNLEPNKLRSLTLKKDARKEMQFFLERNL